MKKQALPLDRSPTAIIDPHSITLPLQGARGPSGAIIIEHLKVSATGRTEFAETDDGMVRLTISLRRGRVRVMRNGSILHAGPVLPGMMRLSQPGDCISGEIFSAAEAIVIGLSPDRVTNLLPASVKLSSIRPILQHDVQTEQLARTLLGLRQFDAQHRGLFGGGVIDALLAILFDRGGRANRERNSKAAFSPEQIADILEFADERLGLPLDLTSWAAHAGLTTHEFARRFRTATGSAPYGYFLRRRIERAQELMNDTRSTLAEIALDVGFSSQSHFTDAFHRVAGISPGRWRRDRLAARDG